MISLVTFLVGSFILFLINLIILRSQKTKFPNQTEDQNLQSTEKIRNKVLSIGFSLIFLIILFINLFYKSEKEILAEKEKKEELDKFSRKKQAESNEIKRLGLTEKEVEILQQHEIPINSLSDEVRNAYSILKSQKYFVDTEILRFTGLAKKTKGSDFEKRVEKTRDSLIKYEDAIGQKQIADFDKKQSAEESQMRLKYGEDLRNLLLDKSFDIEVKVFGKDNKKIKLTYVLFNDVWFRKFETKGYFDMIHEKGFNHIELSDGYDYYKGVRYIE